MSNSLGVAEISVGFRISLRVAVAFGGMIILVSVVEAIAEFESFLGGADVSDDSPIRWLYLKILREFAEASGARNITSHPLPVTEAFGICINTLGSILRI
jgi:hypothetical protein